ncbi:signal peptidase I [Desulfovermiculus halophilus]|jgi:signal peptidase I|uniref:signal peptidase I n=1 Tax=Desulfovermiculus halophilus TaxID=339722 RepID=UPI000484C50B|nr:signal peptidase I [Desulfovermiculus halophilus]
MSSNWSNTLKEYAQALAIALILAFVIRSFVVQAFKIPSGSMLPTLQIGDHLLVNKFIYGIKLPFTEITLVPVSDPESGDIIVFKFPEDDSKDFIKRVIGVPGDTIRIEDKQVFRNGQPLREPYVQHTAPHLAKQEFPMPKWPPHEFDPRARDNLGPVHIPDGSYFVMGDNRDESYDSRFWGFVREEAILGRAWRIYWSWNGITNIRWGRIGDPVE